MAIIKTAKVWIGNRKGITDPIHISQYDTAWNFIFTVYYQDEVYEPSEDAVVVFEGKKADGTVFAMPGDFVGGAVSVNCPASISSAAGIIQCELRVRDGEGIVGTANFEIIVEAAPLKGYVASGDDFSAMQQILDQATADVVRVEEKAQEIIAELPETVEDWLEAHVTPETGYVIDNSLTIEGAAADAKTVGDKLVALDGVAELMFPVNLADGLVINDGGRITWNTGTKVNSDITKYTGYLDISGVQKIIYPRAQTTSTSSTYGMAFYDEDKVYISGQRCIVGAESTGYVMTELAVPEGAVYARFTITTYIDAIGTFPVYDASQAEATITERLTASEIAIAQNAADIDTLNGYDIAGIRADVNTILNQLLEDVMVDFASYKSLRDKYINASNKWATYGGYSCKLIPVESEMVSVSFVGNAEHNTSYAFLTSANATSGATPDFCIDTTRTQISAGESVAAPIPPDAKYIYIYEKGSNGNILPAQMTIKQFSSGADGMAEIQKELSRVRSVLENTLMHMTDQSGWDVPENRGVRNALRKAEQLMELKWTPKAAVPHRTGSFSPNVQVTGVPYSSVKETHKYVGLTMSLRTFMTAVNNPYSLLYTENVSADNSESAYGITYHGTNCATYYGMVCSSLVAAALGFDTYWKTGHYLYLTNRGILEKVYDQSADGVKLGDIYQNGSTDHVKLITGVQRNGYGAVTNVVVSESIGTSHRKVTYTADNFNALMATEQATIYRYTELYKNLEYEPLEFVAVEDEVPSEPTYNNDICTYAGDYAAFRCGESVIINYTKGQYTGMEIWRGDTLVTTVTLDASSAVHAVDVTEHTAQYGKYKARLTDGVNTSEYTYWQMIDVNVDFEKNGSEISIEFSSANAEPVFAYFSARSGGDEATYEFTAAEKADGFASVDANALRQEQYGVDTFTEPTYLRVFFKGEYGYVTNDWLDTGLYS